MKLPEDEPVEQKDQIINGKNHYIIEYPRPTWNFMTKEKIKDWPHQVKNGKPRAGKCQENGNHLPNAPYFPTLLKFL